MPQTKFVVGKALKIGLKPIVAINKVDRPDARATEVINEVFDLFAALDANDEQLDFPILYGSGRNGWMAKSPEGRRTRASRLSSISCSPTCRPPRWRRGRFACWARCLRRTRSSAASSRPYLGRFGAPEPDDQGHRSPGQPR
jgi:hypothetical protein